MASAFEIYLRTGRRVATELELETKFNPWHDPDDGRFTKGADNRMSEDKFDILSALLNEIGSEIAEIVGGDPAGTYLYAEAGEGWIGSSLFKDEGSAIRYFDTTDVSDDLLLEFRMTESPRKRWAVMEYEIKGTKLDAQLKYAEEVDVEDFDEDRREIALGKRYGDKPVIFPPWPGQKSR